MNITVDPKLTFQDCIRDVVRQVIARLPAGTVAISAENLWQLCAQYLSQHPKAPRGTNAVYYARQDFVAVITQKPFTKFVY